MDYQGGIIMRLSTDYYPEYVDFYCHVCYADNASVKVDWIDGDDVRVECPLCGEPTYVRVIE
jgi:hypothetical protein